MEAFKNVIQETTSKFNAGASLKFTATEAKVSEATKDNTSEKINSRLNSQGSFRFTYSKNEIYQLFLSRSSKKVRLNTSCGEYNGMFCKVIKPLLLSLSV